MSPLIRDAAQAADECKRITAVVYKLHRDMERLYNACDRLCMHEDARTNTEGRRTGKRPRGGYAIANAIEDAAGFLAVVGHDIPVEERLARLKDARGRLRRAARLQKKRA